LANSAVAQLRSWPITQRVWSTAQLTKCAAHLANCAAILRGWSTVVQLVNCRAFGQLCHRRSAIGQMRRLVKRALQLYATQSVCCHRRDDQKAAKAHQERLQHLCTELNAGKRSLSTFMQTIGHCI